MKENGIRVTCDRCKKNMFVKVDSPDVSPSMIFDGDFLTNMVKAADKVKHIPEEDGWKEHDGLDFCPKCAEEYGNLVEKFLDGTVGDKE